MEQTMLSARLHAVGEPMRVEEVARPVPRPSDVLIKVKACGVVPNLRNVLRHWQSWFPELPLPILPASFGLDVAGEIVEVGDLVQGFRPGERVYSTPGMPCGSCRLCRSDESINCTNFTFRGYFGFGPQSQKQFDAYPHGGFSQYITAPVRSIVRLPEKLDYRSAARLGYTGTAYAGLRKAGTGPGRSLLVNGATGTLGLGAVMLALAMGSTRILATARDHDRLARVKALAPERIEIMSYQDGGSVTEWARSHCGPDGCDAVIDCLGPGSSGELLMNAIYALRRGGRAINVSGVGEKTLMDVHWMMDQQIEFIGSNWFSISDAEAMCDMIRAGTLDFSLFIHVPFPLADVNQALEGANFRDGGFTNLIVEPNGPTPAD